MDYGTIIYEKQEGVGIVTLNRPEKKNAISLKMTKELRQVFDEIEEDSEVNVMVLTGGPEVFCSGADLSEVQAGGGMPEGLDLSYMDKLKDMAKPTIAAISGPCLAGGIEMALCCDILVASETARIGDGHIKMGLIGGGGSTTRIPRLIGRARALELLLTGDLLSGQDAFQMGLVNHVYPKDKFMAETIGLAKKIAAYSPLALKLIKKAVDAACFMDEHRSCRYTMQLLKELLSSGEFKGRIGGFLGKGK